MSSGVKTATYDYNAFGETIQSDGVASMANHFRFSTKYTDDETGLLYYGLRYYSPSTGRFLGRDPVFEEGGFNLYAFVENGPINELDLLGLACVNFSTSINVDLNSGKLSPTVHFPNGSQIDIDVSGSVRIMLSGKKCDVCCGGDNSKAYAYTASASITGDLTVNAFAGWKLNESYGGGTSVDVWAGVKGSAGSHIDLSDNYSWGGCAGSKFDVHIKTSTGVELKGGGQAKWKWKNGASHVVGEATATGKLEGFEKYITLTECDETGCHGKIKMSNGDVGKFSGNVKFCAAGFGCVERSWSQ
jgi:RHS repeat-associated protein